MATKGAKVLAENFVKNKEVGGLPHRPQAW
jgi:hypothetical protein